MNFTINMDETMFKNILNNELESFNKDEIHSMVRDMIRDYLKNSDVLTSLFVTKRYYASPDNSSDEPNYSLEATALLRSVVASVDITKECEEIRDSVVKEIRENLNDIIASIIRDALAKSLYKSLNDTLSKEIIKHQGPIEF